MKHKIRDGALFKFLSLVSFFSWQNVHVANSKMENDFLINQLWFKWYEKNMISWLAILFSALFWLVRVITSIIVLCSHINVTYE